MRKAVASILCISVLSLVSCNTGKKEDATGNPSEKTTTSVKKEEDAGRKLRERLKLKSKKAFIHEFSFGEPSADGKLFYEVHFDERGNMKDTLSMEGDSILFKESFKYNTDNILVERISFAANGQIGQKVTREVDAEGNETEVSVYDPYGNVAYTRKKSYDTEGNIIEVTQFDSSGTKMGYSTFEYNADNEVISSVEFDQEGKQRVRVENKYDAEGRKLSSAGFDAKDGMMEITHITGHDAEKRPTEGKVFNQDSVMVYTFTLAYDKNGNETEYTELSPAGDFAHQVKRTYGEKDEVLSFEAFGKEGKLLRKELYTYTPSGQLESISFFSPENEKVLSRHYTYTAEGLDETIVVKGKLDEPSTMVKFQYEHH